MTNQKINIQIFNWGPCVVRMKITDSFKKLLLDEGEKNKLDFTDKLAGILDKETGYSEESKKKILPELSQCLGVYDQAFEQYVNKKYEKKPEYILSALWINYQRPNDFNPPHDHDGKLSFVTYLKIPEELKKKILNTRVRVVDLEVYSLSMVMDQGIVLPICLSCRKRMICISFLHG